ncbi:uncharacterized protein LOC106013959 [Aplysia californica]|uniref:Uncharacterized protein LOC106013959 n=1 Tax=Aplysia californica TaxID=6500 RepID=A0ABM1AEW8_APLCA|nr:uncharacterized protein LOC106013959 [Aplysia californica]
MCGPASGWSKIALLVLVLGICIHIAGWATTNWMVYSTTSGAVDIEVGLWRMESCTSGVCEDTAVASQYETGAFNGVRAMETITFCLAVFTAILLIIYMCSQMESRQTFAAVIMILLYIAGGASFIGMVIFITTIPDPFEVSWSLGLTVIAMTLILIAGTLMIPDAFEASYDDDSDVEDDDDYFGTSRRNAVSPSMRGNGPSSRGITPISYRGEGNRWRSY